MKIQPSTKQEMAEAVTEELCFTILQHIWRYGYSDSDSLNNIHFVYYNWGLGRADPSKPAAGSSSDASTAATSSMSAYAPADVKREILVCLAKKSPSKYVNVTFENWIQPAKEIPGHFDIYVNRFVDQMAETNVHVVDGPVLDDWLIPSFLPFPLMFTALGVE
jgi:hypothetical protein